MGVQLVVKGVYKTLFFFLIAGPGLLGANLGPGPVNYYPRWQTEVIKQNFTLLKVFIIISFKKKKKGKIRLISLDSEPKFRPVISAN